MRLAAHESESLWATHGNVEPWLSPGRAGGFPVIIMCWGSNTWGQLGDNTTIRKLVPTYVSETATDNVSVSPGGRHTCSLTSAGRVKCWGFNSWGALGDGTNTDSTTPVTVPGLQLGVIAVSAGRYHTCAIAQTGQAACWGSNDYGPVGDGTYNDRSTPVSVLDFP